MAGMDGTERVLFERFPALDALVRERLGAYPTPVEPLDLSEAAPAFGGAAWVKREDRASEVLGGNKLRKLEFLLSHARELGRSGVLTLGGIGSNHCLATAFYARRVGLRAECVVFPHEATETSRRTLRGICTHADRVIYAPSDTTSVPVALGRYAARTMSLDRPYPIGPGGSSSRGELGWVNAGLELGEQVARGELEAPDAVFCAYSSGGTASGVALGLQLAGVPTVVHAVRVYPGPLTSVGRLRRQGEGARRLIERTARTTLPPFDAARLRLAEGYVGPGYAIVTGAGKAATDAAAALGLTLDPTYTAKAFAAFLDAAGSTHRDAKLVFLGTYDARVPGAEVDETRVPEPLRAYL